MCHFAVENLSDSCFFLFQQEQANDAKLQAASPEDTEDLSPLPAAQQSVKRRGGISAEPVSEEDATSYVKKVGGVFFFLLRGSGGFREANEAVAQDGKFFIVVFYAFQAVS